MSESLRSYAARNESKDRATAYRWLESEPNAHFERGYYLGRAHAWHEVMNQLDLERKPVAKDGRGTKRPKRPVARAAGKKKR